MEDLDSGTARERLMGLLSVPAIEDVHEAVAAAWYLGERFPVPRFTPHCVACGSDKMVLRYLRFFKRGGPATHPYRCDFHLKCRVCSGVLTYGIVIPTAMWEKNNGRNQYHRKEILKILEEMDGV